jgi:hypothetical protein
MPDFSPRGEGENPGNQGVSRPSQAIFHPLSWEKSRTGNPPWERLELQEREWFAERSPEITNASNTAARHELIQALARTEPMLHLAFLEGSRRAEGDSHFVRHSGRYPLTGTGKINTYAVFAELNRQLISPTGRVGCILPSGIATADTTKLFFSYIINHNMLDSFFSFAEIREFFLDTDSRDPFCLVTITGIDRPVMRGANIVFDAWSVEDLLDDCRHYSLSAADFSLLKPNTNTCPNFRSQQDAEINKAIFRRLPVLVLNQA